MNRGLFGGTFNPVHNGHIQIVDTIRKAFALDEMVVIPAANPPHKNLDTMADAEDRLEMTRLAFESMPGITVSDVELRRTGRSYTIDTIDFFLNNTNQRHLYLIMGLDAFLEIHTWKSFMAILTMVPVIIIHRPDEDRETIPFEEYLKSTISNCYTFSKDRGGYIHDTLQPVFFYPSLCIDISSTGIRERLNAGRSVDDFVPPAVATFIKNKGLYQ
ncbi:MAG: nicotinate (nicotinamide) nucleotide adenylyltransferase [Thermodesulfobacteriota bacterium]|nr:nicotinate (nicotinamide) nucleotide adenylyltransferase [Thermodesulfobacteriota bacterium]